MVTLFPELTQDKLVELLTSQAGFSAQSYYASKACNPLMTITTNNELQHMVREISVEADILLTRTVPELTDELYALFQQTGNRLQYESAYFERRRRLTTFGLLVWLKSDNSQYYNALLEVIEAILCEKTWCLPAHMPGEDIHTNIDLFCAETGFALAEIITLLNDVIPETTKANIIQEIDSRIFNPYLHLRSYSWETATHNWSSVCAGSVGAAALLLQRDTEELAAIIHKVLHTMDYYLSGFGMDGACLEGMGYWNYGYGYFVYFADFLYTASEGNINLFQLPKVKSIASFQQHGYLTGNRPANFSDATPRANIHIGLSDYLAQRYEEVLYPPLQIQAPFTEDHCSRFAPALRNLLWFQSDIARNTVWEPGSWYFPDAAWLISRHVTASGNFGFAAKGGSNEEPHNHIDVGHFILLAGDDPAFAADLGCGEYTAAYFGSDRYSYSCTSASGHSLPIISGMTQQAEPSSRATIVEAYTGSQEDTLSIDLTACYPLDFLQSYTRQFRWMKTEYPTLIIEDYIAYRENASLIDELFITKCSVQFITDGELHLRGNQHIVKLTYKPSTYDFSIQPCTFMNHYGVEEAYTQIKLSYKNEQATLENKLNFHFSFEAIN